MANRVFAKAVRTQRTISKESNEQDSKQSFVSQIVLKTSTTVCLKRCATAKKANARRNIVNALVLASAATHFAIAKIV